MTPNDPPIAVGSARNLIRALLGLGVALLLFLCSGGIEGQGPGVLEVAGVAVGTWAAWVACQRGEGPDRPSLRWLTFGTWGLFAGSLLYRTASPWIEALDLVLQAPFVIAYGALVFSHIRPDDHDLQRRVQIDAALLGTSLFALWIVAFLEGTRDVATSTPAGILYVIAGLSAVVGGIALGLRLPDTLRALRPNPLHESWLQGAERDGWTVLQDTTPIWEAEVTDLPHPTRIRIERDPVPARTSIEVELPELTGVRLSRRTDTDGEGAALGDVVLDATVFAEGDVKAVKKAFARARPMWHNVLHTWRATVEEGRLEVTFDGSIPHPDWIGAADDTEPDEVLKTLLTQIAAVSESVKPKRRRKKASKQQTAQS
ncbi:MAG: hypothetical protein KTR31_37550 [Myxococcales bacterium]|nr:hypothetical protein [Myxococcales bacterium]